MNYSELKIFLGSSIKQFKDERLALSAFANELNSIWIERAYLHFEICEEMNIALSTKGKQKEYNESIKESHYFILLAKDDIGKYTQEEFETALESYQNTGYPKIKVFLFEGFTDFAFIERLEKKHVTFELNSTLDDVKAFLAINCCTSFFTKHEYEIKNDKITIFQFGNIEIYNKQLEKEIIAEPICLKPTKFQNFKWIRFYLSNAIDLSNDSLSIRGYMNELSNIFHSQHLFFDICPKLFVSNTSSETLSASDYFYVLIGHDVGEVIEKDFNSAYDYFLKNKKPKIYTYFLKSDDVTPQLSVIKFAEYLGQSLGHYYSFFSSIDAIKLDMILELTRDPLFSSKIEVKEGEIVHGGDNILSLSSVPAYSKNEYLQKLLVDKRQIESRMKELRSYDDFEDDCDALNEFESLSIKRKELREEIKRIETETFDALCKFKRIKDDNSVLTDNQIQAQHLIESGDIESAIKLLQDDSVEENLDDALEIEEKARNIVIGYIHEKMVLIDALEMRKIDEPAYENICNIFEKVCGLALSHQTELSTFLEYASFLFKEGNPSKALKQINKYKTISSLSVDEKSNRYRVCYLLGQIYLKMNENKKALKYFNDAIKLLEPNDRINRLNCLLNLHKTICNDDWEDPFLLEAIATAKILSKEDFEIFGPTYLQTLTEFNNTMSQKHLTQNDDELESIDIDKTINETIRVVNKMEKYALSGNEEAIAFACLSLGKKEKKIFAKKALDYFEILYTLNPTAYEFPLAEALLLVNYNQHHLANNSFADRALSLAAKAYSRDKKGHKEQYLSFLVQYSNKAAKLEKYDDKLSIDKIRIEIGDKTISESDIHQLEKLKDVRVKYEIETNLYNKVCLGFDYGKQLYEIRSNNTSTILKEALSISLNSSDYEMILKRVEIYTLLYNMECYGNKAAEGKAFYKKMLADVKTIESHNDIDSLKVYINALLSVARYRPKGIDYLESSTKIYKKILVIISAFNDDTFLVEKMKVGALLVDELIDNSSEEEGILLAKNIINELSSLGNKPKQMLIEEETYFGIGMRSLPVYLETDLYHEIYCNLLNTLYFSSLHNNEIRDAIAYEEKETSLLRELCDATKEHGVETYAYLATLLGQAETFININQKEKALKYYFEALECMNLFNNFEQVIKRELGIKIFNEISETISNLENKEEIELMYKKLKSIILNYMTKYNDDFDADLASIYLNCLGNICFEFNDYDFAREIYKKSMCIFQNISFGDSSNHNFLNAIISSINVDKCDKSIHELSNATNNMISERMNAFDSDSRWYAESAYDIAETCLNIGLNDLAGTFYGMAIRFYISSIKVHPFGLKKNNRFFSRDKILENCFSCIWKWIKYGRHKNNDYNKKIKNEICQILRLYVEKESFEKIYNSETKFILSDATTTSYLLNDILLFESLVSLEEKVYLKNLKNNDSSFHLEDICALYISLTVLFFKTAKRFWNLSLSNKAFENLGKAKDYWNEVPKYYQRINQSLYEDMFLTEKKWRNSYR